MKHYRIVRVTCKNGYLYELQSRFLWFFWIYEGFASSEENAIMSISDLKLPPPNIIKSETITNLIIE